MIASQIGSAWRFYDVQRQEVTDFRASILLRVLSVDSEGFRDLLERELSSMQGWEER